MQASDVQVWEAVALPKSAKYVEVLCPGFGSSLGKGLEMTSCLSILVDLFGVKRLSGQIQHVVNLICLLETSWDER